jgi:hypothetical protein
MRCSTQQHPSSWGIDLHTRTMDVCILDQAGDTLVHRNRHAPPEALLQAIAPYRDPIVLAAEWMVTWYWLADLWAAPGLPVVLGHALSMQAIPGGKAKNAEIDAQTIAVLRRGGMRPQASVSPRERRATRDRLRRRTPLARQRGALLAHVHTTTSPYNLPALGKKSASQAHRDGVAERVPAPAGPKSLEVDLALIGCYEAVRRDLELAIVRAAKHHDANPF